MRRLVAAALGLMLVASLSACSGAKAPASGEGGFVAGDGTTVVLPAAKRGPAVSVAGTTIAGKPLDTKIYLGDVVLLNVWASWCAPCRAEAPGLQAGWKTWQADGGVQVVGINTRDERTSAAAYVKNFRITYPNLYDKNGRLLLDLNSSLPPNSIPTTLVLDKQGRVAARVLGAASPALLDGIITDLKGEPA